MATYDAVVVGAGSAGLAASAALQRRGVNVIVLESSDAVASRWRTRYVELRLNSWRAMSNLRGLRMKRSVGRYPSRDAFIDYLESYAREENLEIRFDTSVRRIDRQGPRWSLATSRGPMVASYVVVATGWDAVPVTPDWPGRDGFGAELIHAAQFRGAGPYRDREVLVVGAGNSGIDIAGHLVRAGAHVSLSRRGAPTLATRNVLGLPGQPLLVFGADHLPRRLADWSFAFTQRRLFGDLSAVGFPPASIGAYANYAKNRRSPAIDDGFVDALKRGDARVVSEVERFDGDEVVLTDGSALRPDAVICATGYRRGLEGLVGHLGVLAADGAPSAPWGAPEDPRAPHLYFAGVWGAFSGQIRLGPIHARRIANAVSRDLTASRRRPLLRPATASRRYHPVVEQPF